MDEFSVFEIFITLFLIFETFVNIITIRKNIILEKEIKSKYKLYKNSLNEIQTKKDDCNKRLDAIMNDIKHNKVYKDIMHIEKMGDRGEYLCPYHEQIISEYEKFQDEMCSKLCTMKADNESKLENIMNQIKTLDNEEV